MWLLSGPEILLRLRATYRLSNLRLERDHFLLENEESRHSLLSCDSSIGGSDLSARAVGRPERRKIRSACFATFTP